MGKSRVFNRQLDPKLIGAKITRLRTEAGLGRKGLADAMGVAVTSVRAYEIGKVCPEYEHLLPIAQALGVARESLCIYSFSNIGEVLAALNSLCEDYGVMHLTSDEAQGPCCLIPTSEFMVQLFSDWLSVTEQVRSGRMSVADMLSWQDRYRQSYSQEDFPRRCSFELKDKRPEASGNAGFSAWLLSKELPALRKQRGILQGDFANLLGISVAKYRSFEQGRQLPDGGLRHRIARQLDVPASSLVFYDFLNPLQAAHALFQLSNMMHWCSPLLRRFLLRLWREDSCCCGRGRLTQDFAQWYNGIILLKTIASSSQAQQDCRPSWAFLLSMTGFHTLPVLTACFPDEFAVIVAVIGKVYQSCW